jgi:hypothetical protein
VFWLHPADAASLLQIVGHCVCGQQEGSRRLEDVVGIAGAREEVWRQDDAAAETVDCGSGCCGEVAAVAAGLARACYPGLHLV